MRRLSLILTAPLAVMVVIFALTNRQIAEVNLWPFGIELASPLYRLVLLTLLLGFLIGAVIMWISNGRQRRRAREAQWRITDLERDLQDARRRAAKAAKAVTPVGDSRVPSTELTQAPQRPAA